MSTLLNALGGAIRGDLWLINGPISGLIPILLLYGCFEFGLDFFATRSRRERRMDAAMLINCPLGIVVWLMKPHIPLVLLLLLGLSIIATAVTFVLAIRGKKARRKKRRRAGRTTEATEEGRPDQEKVEAVPQEEAELAQS